MYLKHFHESVYKDTWNNLKLEIYENKFNTAGQK